MTKIIERDGRNFVVAERQDTQLKQIGGKKVVVSTPGIRGPAGPQPDLSAQAIEDALGYEPASIDAVEEAQATAEAAQTTADTVAGDLSEHEADHANPHATTAAQVGADPAGTGASAAAAAIAAHLAALNPHTQYILASLIGQALGIAPLGADGKLSTAFLPASILGQVEYQGLWDASAGTPPSATPEKGWYYIVSVAGATSLSGITDWAVGDWAIYNGATWGKVDNTDAVSSVAGLGGAISASALKTALALVKGDVGLPLVDNTSDATKLAAAIAAINLAHIDSQVNLAASQFRARSSTGAATNKTISDLAFSLLDDTTQAAMWATLGVRNYPARAPNPTGKYGMPFDGSAQLRLTTAIVQDAVYAAIGFVAKATNVSDPQLVVTTGQASATARIGLATWDSVNELPGALIVDWGTADLSTNGTKTFVNGSAVANLVPDQLYCIVFIAGGAASAPSLSYYSFVGHGVDLLLPNAASTVQWPLSYRLGAQSAQRTGGFSSPPMGSAPTFETVVSPGMKMFCCFKVVQP